MWPASAIPVSIRVRGSTSTGFASLPAPSDSVAASVSVAQPHSIAITPPSAWATATTCSVPARMTLRSAGRGEKASARRTSSCNSCSLARSLSCSASSAMSSTISALRSKYVRRNARMPARGVRASVVFSASVQRGRYSFFSTPGRSSPR